MRVAVSGAFLGTAALISTVKFERLVSGRE